VLAVVALSGVSMNLGEPFRAVVGWFSPLTPTYQEQAPAREAPRLIGYDAAIRAGARIGPVDAVVAVHDKALYDVWVFGGGERTYYGETTVAVDGITGAVRHVATPADETAGDTFMAWQFPLHSGRAFGLVGQIMIALGGLVLTGLCATGLWLFARRRSKRRPALLEPRSRSAEQHFAPAE